MTLLVLMLLLVLAAITLAYWRLNRTLTEILDKSIRKDCSKTYDAAFEAGQADALEQMVTAIHGSKLSPVGTVVALELVDELRTYMFEK